MKIKNLLTIGLLVLLVTGINSCKKETVDVTDLLRSVPSSAAGVVVFNLEGLLGDAGCKIKNHEVVPGSEVSAILAKRSPEERQPYMMFFEGNTGIEPKGAVVFYDSNRTFLTFALYDVEKFCSYVEKITETTFVEESSGVRICNQVAVKGAQAWICLSSGKRIDPEGIASYASLGASQSFLVSDMGEELLIDESDVRGWILLNNYLEQMLGRRDRTMANIGMGLLYDKAESLQFKMDFKKGEAELKAIVLNGENKPAKFQLPLEKIDINTLKGLGTDCQGMMAFTVTPKLVKKLNEIGKAFGGFLFGDLTDILKNVDGTVGVIASGSPVEDENICGVVTTKGEVSQDLKSFVAENLGGISFDGKLMKFTRGNVSGNLSVEETAEELKGCYFGLVVDAAEFANVGINNNLMSGFKSLALKIEPESGGIEFEIEAKTAEANENSLLTLLK